ncbi:hypothetical protein AB0J83_12510 [Actinoplanes sp. NPDC049596]|uniref:hypothetical protein n=1 Tax=unclassified Actinoplanes TaxID=2626549 RepID=UPI0034121F49
MTIPVAPRLHEFIVASGSRAGDDGNSLPPAQLICENSVAARTFRALGIDMPSVRVQVESDRGAAKKVLALHRAGRVDRASRDAARAEVVRLGRTPAGEPVFVGVTNGEPVHLLYDVEVYLEAGS